MTPGELVAAVRQLALPERRAVCDAAELSVQERLFVDAYTAHFDGEAAAYDAGYPRCPGSAKALLKDERVQKAVDHKLEERAKHSDLTANYVRQMLVDILELTPTDYFALGPDGAWCIDPESFRKLPHHVRRLVRGVELRLVRGVRMYSVEFMSKEAALATAAKFTLTQKHQVAVTSLPWDAIAAGKDVPAVEDHVQELARREGLNGSA